MSDLIDDFLLLTEKIPSPEIFRLWAAISAVAGALERRVWVHTSGGTLYPNLYILLVAPPAVGKCLHPDEPVLMYDGRTKKTKFLKVGDKLMGPDSTPRTVLWSEPGKGQMYKIKPHKGRSWICNEDHILSLRKSREPNAGSICNVTVRDYLKWTDWQKSNWKLWRTGVEFSQEVVSVIEPYFLGVLIGDGDRPSNGITITTCNQEIVKLCYNVAADWQLEVVPRSNMRYALVSRVPKYNPLLRALQDLGLDVKCEHKFIPHMFKTGSRETRLQILAGLLDTDGSYVSHSDCYDFISKSKRLADDVAFIARSLGMCAYVKASYKSAHAAHLDEYWRVIIGGDVSDIPCQIARKKSKKLFKRKDATNVGFSIIPLGHGNWHGITVDKDNMYLLDDFTVIHNSQAINVTREFWLDTKHVRVAPNSVTKASLLDNIVKSAHKSLVNGGQTLLEYHSLSIASSEFGVLVPSHDTEFLSTLIDIFDNPRDFREDRRTSKSVDITNPQLNILAGTQPGYLANLLPEEAWSMGFMSRVIMVYAGSGPQIDIFNIQEVNSELAKSIRTRLTSLTKLYGGCRWTPEAQAELIRWYKEGLPPIPEHSKLTHYIGRRLLTVLKLCPIAAVSRSGELTITLEDLSRVRDWLLQVESFMPDVFKEMVQRSDAQVIQDLHFFMWKLWIKDKKPLHEGRLIHFLQSRVPSEKVIRVLEIAEKSGIIQRFAGTNTYMPRPKHEHGTE